MEWNDGPPPLRVGPPPAAAKPPRPPPPPPPPPCWPPACVCPIRATLTSSASQSNLVFMILISFVLLFLNSFLIRLTKSACDQQRFAGDPARIGRSEENRGRRDVVRLADAAKWRLRFKHFPHVTFGVAAGDCSFRYHHPRINGVHADFLWTKLLGQRSCDGVDRALGRVVNHRCRWSERAGKRTNVNDTAAFRTKVLQRLLRRQHHTKNVRVKLPVKFFFRDFFKRFEVVNSGVIDQDVDLAERFLCRPKELFDFLLLRNIALDRDRFAAALCDFAHDLVRVCL